MKPKLIVSVDSLDTEVSIHQTGRKKFSITYGKHFRGGLSYPDAAKEFGECVMHSAVCAGVVENDQA